MNSIIKKDNNEPAIINVTEETLHVEKQLIEKAKVKIIKKVYEEHETTNISLMSEEVVVTKVPVNKYVAAAPAVRYEENVTIIPVVKEVLVIEKKLLLVEEVHITKHTNTKQHQQTVTLKKQDVTVERTPATDNTI